MKRNLASLMLAVLVFGLMSSATFADNIYTNLSNSVNLPGLNFGYSTSGQGSLGTNFSTNLATTDTITSSFISISRDPSSPDMGWVSASFNGTIRPATIVGYQGQDLSVNHQGVVYNLGTNLSSYQQATSDGKGTIVYGDTYSSANAYAWIQGVIPTSASANYNEYSSLNEGKGLMPADSPIANDSFSAYVEWQVQFVDAVVGKGIMESSPGVSVSSAGSVPEPTSLSLLGIGVATLFVRRRHQR